MIYFSSKKDYEFLIEFQSKVEQYFEMQYRLADHSNNTQSEGLEQDIFILREYIARNTHRVKKISKRNSVSQTYQSFPAPVVGGPVIPVNIYESILNDDGYKPLPVQRKLDIINQLIGSVKERVEDEFYKIINPFYWFGELIKGILQVPFWVFKTAGFRVESFETSLAGKIIRFIELVFLIGFLVYFGFTDAEIKEMIVNYISS